MISKSRDLNLMYLSIIVIDPELSPSPYIHALRPKTDEAAQNGVDDDSDEETSTKREAVDVERERIEQKNPYLKPPRKE